MRSPPGEREILVFEAFSRHLILPTPPVIIVVVKTIVIMTIINVIIFQESDDDVLMTMINWSYRQQL